MVPAAKPLVGLAEGRLAHVPRFLAVAEQPDGHPKKGPVIPLHKGLERGSVPGEAAGNPALFVVFACRHWHGCPRSG
jgi:hypothetical protein